jgi:hypothetical protein
MRQDFQRFLSVCQREKTSILGKHRMFLHQFFQRMKPLYFFSRIGIQISKKLPRGIITTLLEKVLQRHFVIQASGMNVVAGKPTVN